MRLASSSCHQLASTHLVCAGTHGQGAIHLKPVAALKEGSTVRAVGGAGQLRGSRAGHGTWHINVLSKVAQIVDAGSHHMTSKLQQPHSRYQQQSSHLNMSSMMSSRKGRWADG